MLATPPMGNPGSAPDLYQYWKYQGVKAFHMLARIGCYSKIMVFRPFKVKVTYYHPLHQCWGNTFNVLRLSTTLLSPTKSMVARSNQW